MIAQGADKLVICHWNNSGTWNSIEVAHSALKGHDNHEMDIWPPVEDVTDGNNWPQGEAVYMNNCILEATSTAPVPTATATGTAPPPTLAPTGISVWFLSLGGALIVCGIVLLLLRHYVWKGR